MRRYRGPLAASLLVMTAMLVGAGSYGWQLWKTIAVSQELERRNYIAEVQNAKNYFAEGNFAGALALLESQIPAPGGNDYRGWEWHHLWSRCHPAELVDSFTYGLHAISDVEYSPDGSKLAIAQLSSQCAAVLDVATRQVIAELNCDHQGISVAFTPDGSLLAVACKNGEIYIWDYQRGQSISRKLSSGMLRGVAISPDGHQLVTCGDEGLFWADLESLESGFIHTPTEKYVTDCNFSPNGELLITGDRTNPARKRWGEIILYDTSNQQRIGSRRICNPGPASTEVRSVEFFQGNEQVLVGLSNGLVAVWKLGPPHPDNGHYHFPEFDLFKSVGAGVFSVKQSADGAFIANGASNNRVQLRDSRAVDANGQPVQYRDIGDLRAHSSTVRTLDFCPVTGTLATADSDATIRFWQPSKKRRMLSHLHQKPRCIALHESGKFLVMGSEPGGETGSVMCWGTNDFSLLFQHGTKTSKVVDVEFLPDSDTGHLRIVAIDAAGKLLLIDSPMPRSKAPSDFSSRVVSEGPFVRCVFDRTNECVWLGGRDGVVSRMSLDGRIEPVYQPYEKAIFAIEMFPTGSAIVTVCQDRHVTICTTTGEQCEKIRPAFPVREIAVSPNERYLAICGESRKILLFDMHERTQFELAGHFAKVLAIRFSRDGTRLFSAGEDETVRLWETESWQEVFSSESTSGWIVDLDLDEGDSRLFGACTGHSIATWQSSRD